MWIIVDPQMAKKLNKLTNTLQYIYVKALPRVSLLQEIKHEENGQDANKA